MSALANACLVQAVHLGKRLAVCADDEIGDITTMFDEDGDETDDTAAAVQVTVQWRKDGRWSRLDLSDYDFTKRDH